jgi:AraC-like DNA-binding protein
MPDWSIPHGIASARRLLRVAMEHGADPAACLKGTGIGLETIENTEAEITPEQEFQLIRNVKAALPQADELALEAGKHYQLTDFGIWGYALFSSRNLREGLRLALRFLDLSYIFGDLVFDESGDEARLRFDYSMIPADIRQFLIERDASAIITVQRLIAPRAKAGRGMSCAFPEPPHAERFKEVFGLIPQFDAPVTEIRLNPAVMDQPLPQANESTLRVCEAECQKLLARRRGRSGVSAKVRNAIIRHPGRVLDMDTIAAELHMTARTLRRHLASENTTFRELRDEVLLMLAEEMIGTAHMKLAEVAERLGFSDAAAFSHAFKRWKGVTPGSARSS